MLPSPSHIEIDTQLQPMYTALVAAKADLAEYQEDLRTYAAAPTKPNRVDSEATWDTYFSDYKAWLTARNVLVNNISDFSNKIPVQTEAIRRLLPAATWVRVLDGSTPRYIGYTTGLTTLQDVLVSSNPAALR